MVAGLHSYFETYINDNFVGEERLEQLQILDNEIKVMIDGFSNGFVRRVIGFGEEIGVSFPKNIEKEIRESIYGVFAGRNDTVFSVNDLSALSLIWENSKDSIRVKGMCSNGTKIYGFTNNTALDLSINYLASMEIMETFGVSDKVRGMVNNFLDKFTEHAIEVEEKRQQSMMRANERAMEKGLKPRYTLNPNAREDILALFNLTKDLYASGKNAVEVLKEIFALAYEQNKNDKSDFWKNFYENEDGKSTTDTLLEKWDDFSNSLKNNGRLFDTFYSSWALEF